MTNSSDTIVSYASNEVPVDYKCELCGVRGCKLWRDTCYENPKLYCVDCAGKVQNKDISTVDEQGGQIIVIDGKYKHAIDYIGTLVPAVPTEDGYGYWHHSRVPEAGCTWWETFLPLRCQK